MVPATIDLATRSYDNDRNNSSTVEPANTVDLGTGEKTAVLENGGKGSHISIYNQAYITKKKHIWDLKISGFIGGGGGQPVALLGGTVRSCI